MDQALHTKTTQERQKIKRTAKQRWQDDKVKKKGTSLERDSLRRTTVDSNDRGLHSAVDGQRQCEVK